MFLTSVRRLLLRVVRVCARLSGTCGRGGTVSIAEVDLLPLFHDPALVRLPLMSSPPALARAVATNSVTDQGHRPDQISAGLLVDHLIRIPACLPQAGLNGVCSRLQMSVRATSRWRGDGGLVLVLSPTFVSTRLAPAHWNHNDDAQRRRKIGCS